MTAQQPSHPSGRGEPRMRVAARARGGFSATELTFVMVVVGVLGTMVVPRLNVTPYRMDGQVRGAVAALVAAQRVAVKRQHDVVVVFDTVNLGIRIHEDKDGDGQLDSGEHARWVQLDANVRFGLGDAPAHGIGTAAVAFSGEQDGMPAVTFRRGGSASEQGGFYLTSSRAAGPATHPEDTRVVELERATGRANWYTFQPPSWEKGF